MSKKARYGGFAAVHVVIVVVFLALLYGAWRASHARNVVDTPADVLGEETKVESQATDDQETRYPARRLSNGTHIFAPTTVLISLDGFRADFLQRNLTPTLDRFVRSGISPQYMNPSFPSLTFPNHFTLVTGLHPESHGVVGNTFWDPDTRKEFYYTDPERSMQPEWWNAEPLWETAEKQGVRSAIHMWPGSEAHIGDLEPSYVDQFNADEQLQRKVGRILGWLDLPGDEDGVETGDRRPQLIAAYVPNVDADGHAYGPNSTYIRSTIAEVDGMLHSLFSGLEERNLTDVVNVVIVSDHGMATTSNRRLLQLEDLVDTTAIEHIDGWPLYGLRPYDQSDAQLQKLYQDLLAKAQLPEYKRAFDVYLRDHNMPARYHFSNNNRIAPLWLVPKTGWAIVTKDEFDITADTVKGQIYSPLGLHGYDNQHPLMRAIFVARGPAFPHPEGSKLEPFQNTEVYNIVCDSLSLNPVSNNGTLRLPLSIIGLHDFDAPVDLPDDPQEDDALPPEVPNLAYSHDPEHDSASGGEDQYLEAASPVISYALPLGVKTAFLANAPDVMVPTEGIPPVPSTTTAPTKPEDGGESASTRPVVHDGIEDEDKDGGVNRWWAWVTGKLEAVKGWAVGAFGADGKSPTNGTEESAS